MSTTQSGPAESSSETQALVPVRRATLVERLRVQHWNISWWVGLLFTVGSIVWVVNGFQVFMPFANGGELENKTPSGWTAFAGATIFEIGAILTVWEAWNKDNPENFGQALKKLLSRRSSITPETETDEKTHSSSKRHAKGEAPQRNQWIWFSCSSRHWHDLEFLSAFVQLCGASIFWISGISGISQLNEALMEHTAALDCVYWLPQVVGGSGFIFSGLILMINAQRKWYIPSFLSLPWHIGFWNMLGGVGFTMCGAFGFSTRHWAQYQSTLCTFWGAWAFLIGSLVQWYQSPRPLHIGHSDLV